ncbi:HD domain-containing protein [Haladaptatus sp. DJG-WS-42]|uniref:HD domain-containing protein n=1 Tax=Haladaptatus sp. DJG-WS-42 TaxID=3120516 RepID=UPI0030CED10A
MTAAVSSKAARQEVEAAFPELAEIADPVLRAQVTDVWTKTYLESDYESLDALLFGGGFEETDANERQVSHTREVTRCALALADTLVEGREIEIRRDDVVAGALLHDMSKLLETSSAGQTWTELGELIPHPHFAVSLLEDAGISRHIQHIVLAHTYGSTPQPKTIEAHLVMVADLVSANAIFWEHEGEIHFNLVGSPIRT